MPITLSHKVTGLDEISRALKSIPVEMRARILRAAVSVAADAVKESAKKHARRSVRSGALYASIDKKVLVSKGITNASATAIVGPSRDYFTRGGRKVEKGGDRRAAEQPSRYAHLVEFGHMVKARGKRGSRPGKGKAGEPKKGALQWVPPRPFMRPAMMETRNRTQRIVAQEIDNGIARLCRKMTKGN